MKRDHNPRRCEKGNLLSPAGFTMIEVLMTMAIVAIGLLALGAMQISAIRGNSSAGNLTTCATWAQDKVEELMALSYNDSELTETEDPHTEADPPAGYAISWSVADDEPLSGTKQITVTVTGNGKSARLVYVKAQPPEGA